MWSSARDADLEDAFAERNKASLEKVVIALKTNGWKPQTPAEKARWAVAGGWYKEAARLGPIAFPPLAARYAMDDERNFEALNAIRAIDGTGAVEAFMEGFTDRDARIRELSADNLSRLGDARSVTPLIAALSQDPEHRVHQAVIRALSGAPQAVDPLISMLRSDGDAYCRDLAASALGFLGGPPASAEAWKEVIGSGVPVSLGQEERTRILEALQMARRDEASEVRKTATAYLKGLGVIRRIPVETIVVGILVLALALAGARNSFRAVQALTSPRSPKGRLADPALQRFIQAGLPRDSAEAHIISGACELGRQPCLVTSHRSTLIRVGRYEDPRMLVPQTASFSSEDQLLRSRLKGATASEDEGQEGDAPTAAPRYRYSAAIVSFKEFAPQEYYRQLGPARVEVEVLYRWTVGIKDYSEARVKDKRDGLYFVVCPPEALDALDRAHEQLRWQKDAWWVLLGGGFPLLILAAGIACARFKRQWWSRIAEWLTRER